MPIIAARDLVKSYGTRPILTGVSLTITSGERVGLIGDNGSGKSTFARILAGLEVADAGEVVARRGARVLMLEQVPRLDPGISALNTVLMGDGAWYEAQTRHRRASEALAADASAPAHLLAEQSAAAEALEHLGGWEREHEARALLERLGIADVDVLIDALSGGEQRRVALARLLIARPDLAILDEPTNHLDVETIEWLERTLADDFGGALLLITHDRYVLDRLCDRTVEIEHGQIYVYDGGFEAFLAAKAERMAHAARAEHNRQRFLRQELEWLRRQPKARTTKQKARIQRAEAAGREPAPPSDRSITLNLDATRGGKIALELRDLRLEVAGRTLLRGLTLGLRQGERLGVLGPNGCGKSTLLRALVGELTPSAGSAVLGRSQRLAYLDQRRSGLDDRATVYEAIAGDRRTITIGEETLDASAYLQRFLFDGQAAMQRVGTLSGGERARVALARMLQSSASLVILDEPTNDLDITTLAAVESMLCEFGGTVIVVTHDRYFLDRVATAILAFEGDGAATLYQGNYSTYLALRAQAKEAREAAAAAAAAPANTRASGGRSAAGKGAAPAPSRGLTYAESIELRGLPEKIDASEAEVASLCDRLADPAVYQGGGAEAAELHRRLADARDRAAALLERWEALESKREGP